MIDIWRCTRMHSELHIMCTWSKDISSSARQQASVKLTEKRKKDNKWDRCHQQLWCGWTTRGRQSFHIGIYKKDKCCNTRFTNLNSNLRSSATKSNCLYSSEIHLAIKYLHSISVHGETDLFPLKFILKTDLFSSDERSQTVWTLQWFFPDLDSKPIDCSTCLFEHKSLLETLTQHLVKVDQPAGKTQEGQDFYSSFRSVWTIVNPLIIFWGLTEENLRDSSSHIHYKHIGVFGSVCLCHISVFLIKKTVGRLFSE